MFWLQSTLTIWEFGKGRRASWENELPNHLLLYFDAANAVSTIIVVLSAVCMYLSYDITRITSGAPRAWYVIILAFALLLASTFVEAYYDILSPTSDIGVGETLTTLAVLVLFVVGLFMLDRTFRGRFRASQEGSSPSS